MNNKWFIRAAAVVAVCVASLLIAAPVLAPWGWCDVDPVLTINGQTVNIDIAFQGDPAILAEGVNVYINVPADMQIDVVANDPSTALIIHVNHGNTDVAHVKVAFATGENVPASVTVLVDGYMVSQASGNTQSTLVCKFSVE